MVQNSRWCRQFNTVLPKHRMYQAVIVHRMRMMTLRINAKRLGVACHSANRPPFWTNLLLQLPLSRPVNTGCTIRSFSRELLLPLLKDRLVEVDSTIVALCAATCRFVSVYRQCFLKWVRGGVGSVFIFSFCPHGALRRQ